jgi:hypothetical protein
MRTQGAARRKNNPMAPYFVQLREFERRLMRGALEATGGDTIAAANLLGVTRHYLLARAKLLGAVIGNEPLHEPPGLAAKAWNATGKPNQDRKSDQDAQKAASEKACARRAEAEPTNETADA